jgi:surfeit locus 1 family protein
MRIPFRFEALPFAAALTVFAIGAALGSWQLGRAHEKRAIETKMQARIAQPALLLNRSISADEDLEFRKLALEGSFVAGWPLFLENRPHGGKPGFHLLMPFKIRQTGQYVLVARGWLPRDLGDRTKLPRIDTPPSELRIEGIARREFSRVLQLGTPGAMVPGAIVQNVGIPEFAAASGVSLVPLALEQTSDTGDGLVRDWPQPSAGIEKHLGYAFQWFALAATAILFFIVTGILRARKQAG